MCCLTFTCWFTPFLILSHVSSCFSLMTCWEVEKACRITPTVCRQRSLVVKRAAAGDRLPEFKSWAVPFGLSPCHPLYPNNPLYYSTSTKTIHKMLPVPMKAGCLECDIGLEHFASSHQFKEQVRNHSWFFSNYPIHVFWVIPSPPAQ